ncbi:MAG: diguanylate cyclase [Ideonella sp.]|nr:diguanylate cyclase [Ideonella sp.]
MTTPAVPRRELSPSTPTAALAKAALRRLANDRVEPTPEAFARAFATEAEAAGVRAPNESSATAAPTPPADALVGASLAKLIERVVRGVERGGRHWTAARKKDSLQRVLDGSRQDAQRLQARLTQLLTSWEQDQPDADPELAASSPGGSSDGGEEVPAGTTTSTGAAASGSDGQAAAIALGPWRSMHARLGSSVQAALPAVPALPPAPSHEGPTPDVSSPSADRLAMRLSELNARLQVEEASPADAEALAAWCDEADRVIAHRQRLLDQLGALVNELAGSLGDLAEDDSWARGQCQAMQAALEGGLSSRTVRSVGELLRVTRERQQGLRAERDRAREALKGLIQRMLSELGELGSQTGRFHENVGRYAEVIERADSLESLAGVVREMVEESRAVAELVHQTQQRLHDEHTRAAELNERVSTLEHELRRLSAEVATDPLTQVANRRGMVAEFEVERARHQREGLTLSVGLIDIDNFKRLNDELGHAAGDVALRSLAQAVREALRPTDHVARFGGEEFVVMLPATSVQEAQQVLTRTQRSLSGALFLHESRPVFVTFSAGVTAYREGETLDAALERADVALYEAKRTGKNRTCVA